MKKKNCSNNSVEMSIQEFIVFRVLALKKGVKFFSSIKDGVYKVVCDKEFMKQIGY